MTETSKSEQRQIFWLVVATFLLLLIPATLARLTGWTWQPWAPGPGGYGSIFAETKRAATTFAPFAFAGL